MTDQTAYKHRPLRSPRSIRIITLKGTSSGLFKRAPRDQGLEVELEEVSLASSPSYEALSYAWGGQDLDCPLRCHGKILNITRNCELALHHLRRPSKRRLWIDSICIDQDNPLEKNAQIPLMGDIYGKAKTVLVWLGEGTVASDGGIQYLRDVYTIVRPEMASLVRNMGASPNLKVPDALRQKIQKRKMAFQDENRRIYDREGTAESNMLSDVFRRPWFSRMWTVQELVLGLNAVMICGKSEISWSNLVGALGMLVNIEQASTKFHANESVLWSQISVYQQLRAVIHPGLAGVPGAQDKRMSKVLTLAYRLESSNPRDKMFALYGYLKMLGVKDLPSVDYNLPVARVYLEWTKRALLYDQSLQLLYSLGGKRAFDDLPSWTLDWSVSSPMLQISHERFAASKRSQLRFIFAENDELHMAGIIVDTVKERASSSIPPPLPPIISNTPEIYLPNIIQRVQTWQQWITLAGQCQNYPTGEKLDHVILKTILRNGTFGPLPHHTLTNEVLEQFEIWFNIIMGYAPRPNKKQCVELIDEAIEYALSRPAVWALYFKGEIDPLPVINTPEWRIMIATNYAGAQEIHHWIYKMTCEETFFTTQNGYFGTGSDLIRAGDQVVLLAGMSLPMIVRRQQDGRHSLVAPAYIHGIMNGEKWAVNEAKELEQFAFS